MMKLHALSGIVFLSFAAAAFAQQGAKAPADTKPTYMLLESIAALVPPDISLKAGAKLNPIAAQAATDAMRKHALDRSAQLKVKIKIMEASKGAYGGSAFRLGAEQERVQIRGVGFPCELWGYFSKEEATSLSKLGVGSMVTVAGTIARCDLDERAVLVLDLKNCRIVPQSR